MVGARRSNGRGAAARRGLAAWPYRRLCSLRRRRGSAGRQAGLLEVFLRERTWPQGVPEPGPLRAGGRCHDARAPARGRRSTRGHDDGWNGKHLSGGQISTRLGTGRKAGDPRPGNPGACHGASGIQQGGLLLRHECASCSDGCRFHRRCRRARSGHRPEHHHDRRLGAGLPARRHGPDRRHCVDRAARRPLDARRCLCRRLHRSVCPPARRAHRGVRFRRAGRAVDQRRSAQVRLCREGSLDDLVPRSRQLRVSGLRIRRVAARQVQHRNAGRHPRRWCHSRRLGGDESSGRGGDIAL